MVLRPHGIKSGAKTLAPVPAKKAKQSTSVCSQRKKSQSRVSRQTDQPRPSSPVLSAPLSWLIKAQATSEKRATPHRLFDVEKVRARIGGDDPVVKLILVLIEDQNTGYGSVLERYSCKVLVKNSEPIFFFVDLIEGLTDSISGKRV